MTDDHMEHLQAEIRRLLAAALASDEQHVAETERRDELHVGEMTRRDDLHIGELHRRDDLHAHELELIRVALESRDTIGQAKGIIMASMGCSADDAYRLLTKQSQAENRKLVEVAAEIAHRADRRRKAG